MPIPAGDSLVVSVDEFSTYLNNPSIDPVRATLILGLAEKLCRSVVDPLPDGADIVILDVAERAFSNPAPTRDQSFGLYTEGEGPFNTVTPGSAGGGLWLTQNNKATLRSLDGRGGAFTIDTTPAGAGQNLPWWDTGATLDPVWDVPS